MPNTSTLESASHVWQPAGTRVGVRFTDRALAQLRATPGAGVLLGREETVEGQSTVVVDSVQQRTDVPAGYVGLYRTVLPDQPTTLTDEDRSRLEAHMAGTAAVYLILDHKRFRQSGMLYVLNQGDVASMAWTASDSVSTQPLKLPRSRIVAISAATLALMFAIAIIWGFRAARRDTPATGFHLTARCEGIDCVLKWNPAERPLAEATKVEVLVEEGSRESRYALSKDQVAAGSLLHKAADPDLRFSMMVLDSNGNRIRQSVDAAATQAESKPSPVPPEGREPAMAKALPRQPTKLIPVTKEVERRHSPVSAPFRFVKRLFGGNRDKE